MQRHSARRIAAPLAIVISLVGLAAVATPGPDNRLSVEIDSLAPSGPTALSRVQAWSRLNHDALIKDERRFRVDRRAIVELVAYESLVNVRSTTMGGLARFVGPGKIHYKAEYLQQGRTLAEDAEDRGYLPRRSLAQRTALLSQSTGAIDYIAAIMAMFSDTAESYGYSIRCNPGALITLTTAWDFPQAKEIRTAPNAQAQCGRAKRTAVRACVGINHRNARPEDLHSHRSLVRQSQLRLLLTRRRSWVYRIRSRFTAVALALLLISGLAACARGATHSSAVVPPQARGGGNHSRHTSQCFHDAQGVAWLQNPDGTAK